MHKKIRIGALISGGGTNLQAIIDSCESGKTDGEIVFVGTDNPDASGLERAKKHGISTFTVDYSSIMQSLKKGPEKIVCPKDFDLECIRLFAQNRLKIVNRSYPTQDGKKIQNRIVEIV